MAKSGTFAADRSTYLDVIDRVRRERGEGHAAAPRKVQPPRPRADYARREELQRDLARYYERCKDQNRGAGLPASRVKSKCSAIAWTIARKSGRYPDYFHEPEHKRSTPNMKRRTPPRDPRTGLFLKRGAKRRASAGESRTTRRRRRAAPRAARRARAAAPRRRVVYAGAPRRAPSRRRRRGSPRRRRSTAIAIVPVGVGARRRRGSPRRMREMFAWDAPKASAGGILLLATGVTVGAWSANFIHRYAMTYAPTAPGATATTAPTPTRDASITTIAQFNQAALGARPNMWSIGLQLLLAAAGVAGGIWAPWSPVKMFSYGVGIGAAAHLGVQLINGYIVEPIFKVGTANVTPTGARLFAFENIANPAINPPAGATTTAAGLIGAPPVNTSAVSAAAPANQPKDRVPASLGQPAPTGINQRPPVPVYVPPTGGNPQRPQQFGGGQPPNTQQAAPPPNNAAPPPTQVAAPPPAFGPPGGGNPAPPPAGPGGGGGGAPCGRCGPSCNCQPTSLYGQPPAEVKKPHPLFAALRAA